MYILFDCQLSGCAAVRCCVATLLDSEISSGHSPDASTTKSSVVCCCDYFYY